MELSVNQGIILRGERLLIPTKLRPDVLDVAHEGCPGRDSMLRQLRMDVWWPGMHQDQLSMWPKVEIVSSTSFDKLKPALERSWALLGIPDRVTHDNRPALQLAEMGSMQRKRGLSSTLAHWRTSGPMV